MPLPASPPITLSAIQTEFSAANLAAASTAAGLDPLPTSMLDFLGKSAYTPQLRLFSTLGLQYYTIPAEKPAGQTMNLAAIGGGGGGGGAIAGNGYTGEPGGYSAAAGGGGGGGAYAGLSNAVISAGTVVTIYVGDGGYGISGIASETSGNGGISVFKADDGQDSQCSWTGNLGIWVTGGRGGRTGNSRYEINPSKLTNGDGGNSGYTVRGSGTRDTPGHSGAVSLGPTDTGVVDQWIGGGGGGAGGVAGGDSTDDPGPGLSLSITGIPATVYGMGGYGGSFNLGPGENGTILGQGGEGAGSYEYTSNPPVSTSGGKGQQGIVALYV